MEPLRKRSFEVSIDGTTGFNFLAKSVNKPTLETDVNEYRLINQVVKFPTVPKWNEITIKYVDTKSQNVSKKLLKMMTPKQTIGSSWTADAIEKHPKGKKGTIDGMTITQYDSEKAKISTWKFKNPFIRSINFGDHDYSSDDFVEVEVVVVYDWAYLE
jgi:hypothetical protein